MVATPPVILVFDISALSATTPSEWREFARVGGCYLPQVIYEEMRLLFDRSPDPDLERIAKAFNRFYASSGWQITDVAGHHTLLKVGSGQALTRRARLSLAVARCAYGLAQTFPTSLVVLVSKDRGLLQRLYDIPCVNLCGITADGLLQWSRTGQRPVAVSQKFQQFRSAYSLPAHTTGHSHSYQRTSPNRITPQPPQPTAPLKKAIALPEWLPDALSLLLAAAGVSLAVYLIWLIVHSAELRQFIPSTSNPAPGSIAAADSESCFSG